jgi:hypothetical protein
MPRKKTQKQKITLFYPNQIKIKQLEDDVITAFRSQVKRINYFLFFHILSEPYFELNNNKPSDFIEIHRSILKTLFRDEYLKVLDILEEHGYINKNESYSTVYHYCKSYRINLKMLDLSAPFAYTIEEYDNNFKRKLQTLKTLNLSEDNLLVDEARKHVMDKTQELILVPSNKALEYVEEQFKKTNNTNTAESYFTYFNNMVRKPVGIDKFGNRVHSIITNMPKILRQCLRFNTSPTEPLTEIDIVNSQPFFLSAVTSALIKQFVPDAYEAIPVFQRYENEGNSLLFKNLCADGEIYEYLLKEYEIEYGVMNNGNNKQRRDYTKRLVYSVFFGDYNLKEAVAIEKIKGKLSKDKHQFYLVFKKSFPIVHKLFSELKSMQWDCTINKRGERKQYANNCLLAQRLESGVMYSHIVQACIDNGFTDIVSVHDCLIVRKSEYDTIKSLSLHEFQTLNLNPKFK